MGICEKREMKEQSRFLRTMSSNGKPDLPRSNFAPPKTDSPTSKSDTVYKSTPGHQGSDDRPKLTISKGTEVSEEKKNRMQCITPNEIKKWDKITFDLNDIDYFSLNSEINTPFKGIDEDFYVLTMERNVCEGVAFCLRKDKWIEKIIADKKLKIRSFNSHTGLGMVKYANEHREDRGVEKKLPIYELERFKQNSLILKLGL